MILDAEQSAFIQSGVSVDVAGRDIHNVPAIARGAAARVDAAGRITLFIPREPGLRALSAIAATRAVAAVFCRASTLRTVQVKGSDAEIVAPTTEDLAHAHVAVAAFVADLASVGFENSPALAGLQGPDLVAVRFTPDAGFMQTPGPAAGARL